jgi:hypothetical protein
LLWVLPIRALARFESVVVGWPITIDVTDEVVIEPPTDDPAQEGQIPLVFVPVPEPKTTKNRILECPGFDGVGLLDFMPR